MSEPGAQNISEGLRAHLWRPLADCAECGDTPDCHPAEAATGSEGLQVAVRIKIDGGLVPEMQVGTRWQIVRIDTLYEPSGIIGQDPATATIIDFAALAAQSSPALDVAWLCERGQRENQAPTVWWTGSAWSMDANEALRFPSKASCEAYIEERSPIPSHRDRWARAVEHGWVDMPRKAIEQARAALAAPSSPALDVERLARALLKTGAVPYYRPGFGKHRLAAQTEGARGMAKVIAAAYEGDGA